MPQRNNKPTLPVRHQHIADPLTACLDADSTYICTAYNSRCYIIQKVLPSLNPAKSNSDADIFRCKWNGRKQKNEMDSKQPSTKGCVYMNGDVGKVPSGAVCATPEPHAPSPTSDFSLLNGVTDQLETYSDGGALPPCGQAPPENAPDSSNNTSLIPREQLKQMLSSQLEYYFSRENLANDAYLLSQMDNDQYVPIWTVANFNQVKKLTSDMKLITEVLRESPNVQVDSEGLKVRPNHKRCIVILREIPDSTPLEEVKALFSGKGCPKLISCEFAHNNSWYVTFENDDDAQKAYRFLREEVREFQGKPIMARIKAKPMNRLPIPPVGPGMTGLKNGYRTPPASAASASVYDPTSAFQPGQQRFLYTNGTSLPPNVNYPSQVQIFPFYPPSMLPTWGHTSPGFLDFGSVFSVNGLTPQSSFTKTHTTRFTQRNRNKKNSSGLEQRTTMSDSGLVRGPHMTGGRSSGVSKTETGPSTTVPSKSHYYRDSATSDSAELPPPARSENEDTYRAPTSSGKESVPPRRRRKEEETQSRGGGSPGPQFDLEADAFPPLPGLELSSSQANSKSTPPAHSDPPQSFTEQASPQWTESRTVPVTVSSKNCGLEKLSKTEEVVVNGNGDPPSGNSNGSSDTLSIGESKSLPYCPSTNVELPNPSTHTQTQGSAVQLQIHAQSQADIGGFVKLSYAQVAQHHKEKAERERHQQVSSQSAVSPPLPSSPHSQQLSHQQHIATAIVTVTPNNQPQSHSDDEKKDSSIHFHPKGKSEVAVGRGRGGARSAPRRRDNLQRFNSRQRSPK